MGYLEFADKYTAITKEIGYIEKLMKKDKDLKYTRKLEALRREQKKLSKKLDEYNGVKNE